MQALSVRLLTAHHSVLATKAVVMDRVLTSMFHLDSTAPVLKWTNLASSVDNKSMISPIRRRSAVVFPSRGNPEKRSLRKRNVEV